MLLIVLAGLAMLWIGVVAVVAGLCADAARGDRQLAAAATGTDAPARGDRRRRFG